jgi:Ser/Thr protein kinase RdoA (MazF antagonist)
VIRKQIAELCQLQALPQIAALFGTNCEELSLYADYEGCQNLVYDYQQDGRSMILRISFRPDRSPEQILAEVHFINYLFDHGVQVSRSVPSLHGNLVEALFAGGQRFVAVSFVKGKGMRVPDNDYRYREGVPIDEYFRNWGHVLGQMHALTQHYFPLDPPTRRPEWLEQRSLQSIYDIVPENLPLVRTRLVNLLSELAAQSMPTDAYGLIHNDFNDGNFTVDYETGNITVFDFDDACYGWFMYDLACAWEGGVGRTMFQPEARKRMAFMERYFDQVMLGYYRENTLAQEWLGQLPLFLKVVEMESLLSRLEYRRVNLLPLLADGEVSYLVRCIEDQIPYLGFFDSIYSAEKPFSLSD